MDLSQPCTFCFWGGDMRLCLGGGGGGDHLALGATEPGWAAKLGLCDLRVGL